MFVVDAQTHIWAPETPERPWIKNAVKPPRDVPLEADELLREMDAAGVARAVLVPPGSWDTNSNDLVLKAAQEHADRFGVMGRLGVEAPDARSQIPTWRQQPGMLGLRCSFNKPQWSAPLEEGRVDWLWTECEIAGVPIMLMVTQAQVRIIDRIAERFPGLKLTIDHMALPTGKKDEEAFRDFELLLPIARRPNVGVKVSTLPVYTSDSYPYRSLHPYLRRVYDTFGPKRMFWGGDLSRLPCSYKQAITMFTEEIRWLGAEDKQWIMGRALCDWLGWKLPAGLDGR